MPKSRSTSRYNVRFFTGSRSPVRTAEAAGLKASTFACSSPVSPCFDARRTTCRPLHFVRVLGPRLAMLACTEALAADWPSVASFPEASGFSTFRPAAVDGPENPSIASRRRTGPGDNKCRISFSRLDKAGDVPARFTFSRRSTSQLPYRVRFKLCWMEISRDRSTQ